MRYDLHQYDRYRYHLAGTADTTAESSETTSVAEQQRKQAADIRAATQSRQQQHQQLLRAKRHQDPSPRPQRHHNREIGEKVRNERGSSVTSRRSRTASPGRGQEKQERNEGKKRIRRHLQPSTASGAIRQIASHHRRAIMVVTSLVLSLVTSLSPVVTSLPFTSVKQLECTSAHLSWHLTSSGTSLGTSLGTSVTES